MKLSVIICSHNPRPAYLAATLAGLRDQSLPGAEWELLIIDNASAPPLAESAEISWHPHARIIREETLGVIYARMRGLREAAADLVLFVDDDNVLDADYLETGLRLGDEWPRIGCWGGQLLPRFESEPEEWTKAYWDLLAITPLERDLWSNVANRFESTPPTAGMFVRRAVWEAYLRVIASDPRRLKLGAKGDKPPQCMSRCEDSDLAFTACDLNLGTARFVALRLQHLMPASRLTEGYLEKLVQGVYYSALLLKYIRGSMPEPASKLTRACEWLQAKRLPARMRRFYEAEQKGRNAALREISLMEAAAS